MLRFCFPLLALPAVVSPLSAIVMDSYSANRNDRFADHPLFIGNAIGLDFSGVGRVSNSVYRTWATMIGPNTFISSIHYGPFTGANIQFFEGNDPNATPVERTVHSSYQVLNTDIRIGFLTEPVPSTIAKYSLTDGLLTDWIGSLAVLSGQASQSVGSYAGASVTNQGVARNVIDGTIVNASPAGFPTSGDVLFAVANAPTDDNYTTYESLLQTGDSGSPLFVFDSGLGEYTIGGVAWYINSDDFEVNAGQALQARNFTAYTYTGSYLDEINGILQFNPIPESSATALLALPFLGSVMRRRNRI